jgi:ATP-binding cassette, subfamily C, type I secretion system permease/ATPase
VGAWQPIRGSVRIDGVVLDHGSVESLGSHIGYLSQDVGLSAGTVAENIASFDPKASAENIIAAARAAGVHDMIVCLAEGTKLGSARAAPFCRQVSGKGWRWPCMAIRSWSCWTSRTPDS